MKKKIKPMHSRKLAIRHLCFLYLLFVPILFGLGAYMLVAMKQISLLLFFIFWPFLTGAQDLFSPIYNYRVFEYNAAGQNWGVAANDEGEIFVANDKGLLQYNGESWVLNRLPNATIVRSVATIGEKVYTGSYEEFGYWEKNKTGLLKYTSLTHLIKDHTFTNEEFWQIVPHGDSIIFRSFSTIYVYKNDTIKVINPDYVVTSLVSFQDKIWVSAKNNGLFHLESNALVPLDYKAVLKNKTVIDLVPLGDRLLIGTQLHGCFVLKDERVVPLDNALNTLLEQYQLNKILCFTPNDIAFGTIKNGMYLYDTKNNILKNLNRESGLQNNTILSMASYKDQIWAGLENGIDRIKIKSPITYFTDYSGALGTVHDIFLQNEMLYLGSNTGIYYFNRGNLSFFDGSQGHVWDMEEVDGDLLVGHNAGTFKIVDQELIKVSDIAGGYQFVNMPEYPSTFLQGTYTGIAAFERNDEVGWSRTKLKGIDFPVKQLCFENANTLWAAHPYKGIFRFRIDTENKSLSAGKELRTAVLPNSYSAKVYRIKNQITIQSDGVWHSYNPITDEIVPFEEFNSYKNKALIYNDDDHFWFIDNDNPKELIYTDLRNNTISITEEQLNQRLVPGMERIVKQNDSTYLLTLADGFARINLSRIKYDLEHTVIPVPILSYFKDSQKRYALDKYMFGVPFKNSGNLEIQVAVPEMMSPHFYYKLSGPLSHSKAVVDGTISFQNLRHGHYTLEVSTVSMDGKNSDPLTIQFVIAPPWYLSKISLFGYVLMFIAIIFAVRWYNRRKLKRKHDALKLRLHREQQEHMARLEREKLEKEIKDKQKELAQTTMNVAKKNELILELKDMLVMNKEAFPNRQRYRSISKKLDSSINEDEDWKHFEVNFNELHGDFFENLLKKYPKLTSKDLKLCAYLKMNLTTKEIAPLMGITVRGVEIHRYRLRKKLHIDSSQNLSNFLIKFN